MVFYELLTGRRPFISKAENEKHTRNEVLDLIITTEPRPPRQIDDEIPRELERISLKALSKRATDRYSTAKDMAEDLRFFLQATGDTFSRSAPTVPIAQPGSTLESAPLPFTSQQSDSDERPIKIMPKGLRSFDEHDADFFLELLPGPRDRDGLPDSIRFWKHRIEQIDPDLTFKVGLIYGPSGCGKSSLMKAGLLPRLGKHVLQVYVEATAEETEPRLLKAIRKACPGLSHGLGLVDSLSKLRRGLVLPPERKVLLVLDQFEQWLHARRGEENTTLVAALRHCDGEHVQSLVTVRDDFWLAASRFMRELEIRLVEGHNSALVDLFDPRHAKKVLAAFGRAYGALPESVNDLSDDQQTFLDQAILGLIQDGKVISVRLALFAEMMKGKPWTPTTLRAVGGTEGVGLTFLEDTFSAPTAPPEHRLHQKAAQVVLKALLPESGTDIKGQMRSRQELLQVSGYANRPREFNDLVHILDPELRLITPTDPEGSPTEGQQITPSGQYYQLAHDYLVHSLSGWLTRKQGETRQGRAELRLAERSSLWNAKPENRHLPSALEWAHIRLLTKSRDWTAPQSMMMQKADRAHGLRGLGMVAVLGTLLAGAFYVRERVAESNRATIATGLVDQLLKADTAQVPGIVDSMKDYRRWVDPALREELVKAKPGSPQELHARLALLASPDPAQIEPLCDQLLTTGSRTVEVVRQSLKPHQELLTPKLWAAVERAKPGDDSILPAASTLALFDPKSPSWAGSADKVASALVRVNPILLGGWIEMLRPVGPRLTTSLAAIYRGRQRPETERTVATTILMDYARADGSLLAEMIMDADPTTYVTLFPAVEQVKSQVIPLFRTEIRKTPNPDWQDAPLSPPWIVPDPALVRRVEAAEGSIGECYGFCQTMPLYEFGTVAEGLRRSGYRPTRFRPYTDVSVIRVAAVWTRDGRDWRLSSGLTASEARSQYLKHQTDGYLPVDVASYVLNSGKPVDRYAAIWVKRVNPGERIQAYVGLTQEQQKATQDQLKADGLVPSTLQVIVAPDGQARYSGVWIQGEGDWNMTWDQTEATLGANIASWTDKVLSDIALSVPPPAMSSRKRARTALETAEQNLKKKPEDLVAHSTRAQAFNAETVKPGHLDHRYAAVWSAVSGREAVTVYGLDPSAQRKRGLELEAGGYRLVSMSVARTASEGDLVTASVWQRPMITENAKDVLAERQARAAVALVRLGSDEVVWSLLKHGADPRCRSFIINWLSPLGADPKAVAVALEHIDPGIKPTPVEPPKVMDAILFHPETSERRALILVLGRTAQMDFLLATESR